MQDAGLTEEEIQNFAGLCDSYREMEEAIYRKAPSCHFRKMQFMEGDPPDDSAWWECSYCGHTKPVNR